MRRLALALTLALLAAGTALAAPGDPDPSFGTGGERVLDYGGEDVATDVLVQPDGKVVVASVGGAARAWRITRLNSDGSPDGGFASGGTAVVPFGESVLYVPVAAALGAGGEIVVVGTFDNGVEAGLDVAVLKLLANGQPDTSFGPNGVRTIDLGESEFATGVALDPFGDVTVAMTSNGRTVLRRLTDSGTPDPEFNNGAPLVIDIPTLPRGGDLLRLSGGRLLVVAEGAAVGPASDIVLARVTPEGALDTSFSDDGIASHDLGGNEQPGRAAIQTDGKIVVAALAGATELFSIVRFTAGGALDTDFGNGGLAGIDTGGLAAVDVAAQVNGKLIAVGANDAGRAQAIRVQPGGTLDSTFNGSGQNSDVFSGEGQEDFARAVALQRNGAILVAGQSAGNAVVARLQGDGAAGGPAPTPGSPGGPGGPGGGPGGGGGPKGGVPRCAGKRATIVGTARSDRLKGTRRADVIVGLGGGDRIAGGGGKDVVCGGDGNDRLDGGGGSDRLFGQSGRDALGGAAGNDLLDGGAGNDALGGGPGKDNLLGQAGRDRLTGGPGKGDRCEGNAGRDKASCERGGG